MIFYDKWDQRKKKNHIFFCYFSRNFSVPQNFRVSFVPALCGTNKKNFTFFGWTSVVVFHIFRKWRRSEGHWDHVTSGKYDNKSKSHHHDFFDDALFGVKRKRRDTQKTWQKKICKKWKKWKQILLQLFWMVSGSGVKRLSGAAMDFFVGFFYYDYCY